jgi:ABC-type polysaccharide/polyol phosphate transport system ATPase subunit
MSFDGEPTVIRVDGVIKDFRIYGHPFDLVKELLIGGNRHRVFRALDEIGFEVRKGEIIGLVGRNGAGKSTLLKIITGVLDYDRGSVQVGGKVSAILELGSGFHPEYTGRENVYFDGICMGMSRHEILSKMPDIIEFAELGAVIDQQFRTYSSGMRARLAFATAISVDADILIIDEALSVGDALFQEKCFQRLREIATSGCTVFFVTHSLGQVYALCTRALLMHKGRILADGEPRRIGYEYELLLQSDRSAHLSPGSIAPVFTPDDEEADYSRLKGFVSRLEVRDSMGNPVTEVHFGERYAVCLGLRFNQDVACFGAGFRLETSSGMVVSSASTALSGLRPAAKAGDSFEVRFAFTNRFGSTQLIVSCGVSEVMGSTFVQLHSRKGAKIIAARGTDHFGGLVDLGTTIDIVRAECPLGATNG